MKRFLLLIFYHLLLTSLFPNQSNELFDAVKSGSLPRVRRELGKDISVNSRDKDKKTPLIAAVESGDTALVRFFISFDDKKGNKTDINAADNEGKTALIRSVINGNSAIVRLLVNVPEADIMIKDSSGKRAIDYANERGNNEIIQIITTAISVHREKITNLAYKAVDENNIEIFTNLINDGANINEVLIYAIQKEQDYFIKELIIRGGNFKDNFFYNKKYTESGIATELQWASSKGDYELSNFLLKEKKEEPNFLPLKGDIKIPSLIFAVQSGNPELVELLLKNNASLKTELFTQSGKFPLIEAVKIGNEDIINLLTSNRADLTASDDKGFSALYYAYKIITSKPETHKIFLSLLKAGDDINSLQGGMTLLMRAIQEGNTDGVRFLLANKADYNVKVSNNRFYNGFYSDAVKMAFGVNPRNKDIIKLLLTSGAKPELDPDYEKAIILWSISMGDTEFTEMLLKKGININYYEVAEKVIDDINIYMLELFIKYGLDVNCESSDGKTPLFKAVTVNDLINSSSAGNGSYEIVEILVKNKADILHKDRLGKTAVDYTTSKRIKNFLHFSSINIK